YDRIQTLFHDVADLPDPERRAFLESACGGDDTLISDVLSMVDEDARSASLLDRDLAQVAHGVLDGGSAAIPRGQFGPYRLTSVLGEGGMGIVYRAERADLGSVAAIKILRDAWVSPA